MMTAFRVPPAPFLAGVAHTFDWENAVPVLELLPVFRSVTELVTLAVSGYPPMALGVTSRLTVAVPLRFRRLQVNVGAAKLQEPWVGVAETKVRPAGSVSVNVTPLATEGPRSVTVIVYVRLFGKNADDPMTLTARSACSGWIDTAATDQLDVALNCSERGTLGAPARVDPVPRTSGGEIAAVEVRFHCAV